MRILVNRHVKKGEQKSVEGCNIRTKYAGEATQGTHRRRNSSWLDLKRYTQSNRRSYPL